MHVFYQTIYFCFVSYRVTLVVWSGLFPWKETADSLAHLDYMYVVCVIEKKRDKLMQCYLNFHVNPSSSPHTHLSLPGNKWTFWTFWTSRTFRLSRTQSELLLQWPTVNHPTESVVNFMSYRILVIQSHMINIKYNTYLYWGEIKKYNLCRFLNLADTVGWFVYQIDTILTE